MYLANCVAIHKLARTDEPATRTDQVARLVVIELQGSNAFYCRCFRRSGGERSSRTWQEGTGCAVPETFVEDGLSDLVGSRTFPDFDEIGIDRVAHGLGEPSLATAVDIPIGHDLAARERARAEHHFPSINERASKSAPGKYGEVLGPSWGVF